MKNNNKVFIGIIILFIIIVASLLIINILNPKKGNLIALNYKQVQSKIKNKDSFILIASASTCSHCAEYKPRIKKVLAKYEVTGYYIEKDLLNAEETTQLNNIANISGTPATIFIIDGEEKSSSTRISGARSTDVIVSRLKAMGYIKK